MNKTEMFAQLFGIFGSISMMLSDWQKSKNKMMLFLTFDSILYFIQYMLLRAYSGAFFECFLLITSILSIIKLKRVTDDKIIKI